MEKTLKGNCQSCLMPFKSDPMGAKREHENYCSYCFSGGKLTYPGNDKKEFKKQMVKQMVAKGDSKLRAKFFAFMAGFAPRWKNK